MDKLRVRKRIVSTKRHTVGFVLENGLQVDRKRAVSLARDERLYGVRVVKGHHVDYLAGKKRSLYTLPMLVK